MSYEDLVLQILDVLNYCAERVCCCCYINPETIDKVKVPEREKFISDSISVEYCFHLCQLEFELWD